MACNGNVAVLFVLVGLGLMQVSRSFGHMVSVAYFSVGMIVMQTLLIVIAVCTQRQPYLADDGVDDDDRTSTWELFVGMGEHEERYKWYNVCAALGVFIYSCLPNCLVVEVRREPNITTSHSMTPSPHRQIASPPHHPPPPPPPTTYHPPTPTTIYHPPPPTNTNIPPLQTMALLDPKEQDQMTTAVDRSFVFYIVIYLLSGIPAVLSWGGDISNPIMLGDDGYGVITKLILIYSTMVRYPKCFYFGLILNK